MTEVSMSGHTALPWREALGATDIRGSDNFIVAMVNPQGEFREVTKANRALIVTAVNERPALLRLVDELETALRSADQWIKLLVEEMEIEPADTTVTAGDGKRELVEMNLAQSQLQYAAVLSKMEGAR